MKLLELRIEKIRGITDLNLKPNGKSLVIWGPNGSGKSAVVDALDFLLTGRILRLTGKGTGCISLGEHGPHVDYEAEEAKVHAKIQLSGIEPIEIERCLANPSILIYNESSKPQIEQIISIAQRGQQVLTRREILKYITADPSTRAKEIQDLLNLTEIEDVRKALVRVKNDFDKDFHSIEDRLSSAERTICQTTGEKIFDEKTLLETINKNRHVLGGNPIGSLASKELKSDLVLPAAISGDKPVNITLFNANIINLIKIASEIDRSEIKNKNNVLIEFINTTKNDPDLLNLLNLNELTELGIKMIDATGRCPLCNAPWPPGELKEILEGRLKGAELAASYKKLIEENSKYLSDEADKISICLQTIIAVTQTSNLSSETQILQKWEDKLIIFIKSLNYSIENYPDARLNQEEADQIIVPKDVIDLLTKVQLEVKSRYPETTPEQTSWELLIRLEENLKVLEEIRTNMKFTQLFCLRANILLESFQQARDSVLNRLYMEIQERFEYLYRQLHGQDESEFNAKIKPNGAGLDLEVDFYGRGTFPPHAFHSEGHQDSMGLCLYLALAERLNRGLINLFILDDVVMSVDADHRRDLCHLLATSFPNQQFIITTHDKTWAYQLKTEGVIDSNGMIEFYNWHLDTGPLVNYEQDMWEKIIKEIESNDIPGAAHRLRRGSEQFFAEVCDALQGEVKYKISNRWDLGEFLPSSIGEYNNLLKIAKKTAQSWKDDETFEALNDQNDIAKSIFIRTQAEQWAINPNVHYSKWADFSKKDFIPVANAFKDLFDLFKCRECGGLLRLATTGHTPANVRCNCGKVNWNLVAKR